MKKSLIIIFWVLLVIVSYYFLYKNWNDKKETQINVENTLVNSRLVLPDTFENKVLDVEDEYVKFDVKYPFFKNVPLDFNIKIENLLKASIEEHKTISKENWQSRYDTQTKGENIPKIPTDDKKFSFFSEYKIVESNTDYISFVFKYGGFSGGAHGYENYVSYNYDVKNKKVIELKDLFEKNTDYLNKISTTARESLKKKFTVIKEEDKKDSSPEAIKEYIDNIEGMIEIGTEPKIENFSVFTFTPNMVKIYFGQYQVVPYAFGMPEVEIYRK